MQYEGWFTKQETAARVGVSIKTVERMAGNREIEQRFRKRPGGTRIAVFNPADVDRVMIERAEADLRPYVMPGKANLPARRSKVKAMPSAAPAAALEHCDVLTLDEAARFKGYGVAWLKEQNAKGKLPFYRVAGRRARMIRRRDLDRLADVELEIWTQVRRLAPGSVVRTGLRDGAVINKGISG